MGRWTHHHAPVNGIAMHWVEQGEGPAIVLCHGFPHLWISWHRQIGPLADADLAARPRLFLERVFYALSGDYHYLDVWQHPPGTPYIDALPEAPPLPWAWLESWEMDWLVAEYSRTGFTGGLNWYRAMDIRWQQRAAWRGQASAVPFHFIGSENDVDLEAWHGDDPLGTLSQHWSDVQSVRMVPRAGHMLQLERSADVTAALLEILGPISAARR